MIPVKLLLSLSFNHISMQVELNRKERIIIKEIMRLQLDALSALMRGDCEEDLTLWCIERGATRQELLDSIDLSLAQHQNVFEHPGNIFRDLDADNLSIARHILHREIPKSRAKRSIWRKMNYFDSFKPINLN